MGHVKRGGDRRLELPSTMSHPLTQCTLGHRVLWEGQGRGEVHGARLQEGAEGGYVLGSRWQERIGGG